MRVVLAEDSVLLREGLVRLLQEYGATVVAAVGDGVGYLLKDRVTRLDELAEALSRVVGVGTVLDPEVVSALFARGTRRDPLATLTAREREVLGLVAEGRTNGAVARALVLSRGGVEKHISSIFDKLGLAADRGDDHRRVLAVLAWLGI